MKKSLIAVAVVSTAAHAHAANIQSSSTNETVVVTANRFAQSSNSVLADVDVVTRDDIRRSQAKSIPEVLRKLTGIQLSQNGGRGQLANIYVRGTNPTHVLVLVDGVRFVRSTKGAVDFNQIPLSYVERIEYVRGARASLYGSEAIGGVINIITIGRSHNRQVKLDVGLGSNNYQQAGVTAGIATSDDGQLNLSLGHESNDGYNVHPVAGLNDGDRHGFKTNNGLLGYTYDLNEAISVYANGRIYNNGYQYDSSYSTHGYMQSDKDDQSWTLGGDYKGEEFHSSLLLNYQQQKGWNYNKEVGKSSASTQDKLEQSNVQWSSHYVIAKWLTIAGGIDWRDSSYEDLLSDEKFSRANKAIYALMSSDIDKFKAELSGRIDDNDSFGTEPTFNTALGYQFLPEIGVKASYGTGFKAPNLYQQFDPTYGTEELDAEKSKSYEISLLGAIEGVNWNVTGYSYDIDQLIDYDYTTSHYQNVDGTSHIKGLEFEVKYTIGMVDQQFSADFKDPKDSDGNVLARRSRQVYKWNSTINFDTLDWSIDYMWASKRPDSSAELPSYALVNTSINYYVSDHVMLSGKIANVFDKNYETASGYPAAGREYYMNASYQF